jgi:hypothetical protein
MFTGRKPTIVAAAALLLAVEFLELNIKQSSILDILGVTQHSAFCRLRELKDTFIQLGIQLLPWGGDINRKNVVLFLSDIINQLQFLDERKKETNSSIQVVNLQPPSLHRSQEKKDIRRQKIQLAKQRLANVDKQGNIATNSNDEVVSTRTNKKRKTNINEDLQIEKLLLEGVSEEDILEDKWNPTLRVNIMPSMDSEVLADGEIPDDQLSEYIRSPPEVEEYKQLIQLLH